MTEHKTSDSTLPNISHFDIVCAQQTAEQLQHEGKLINILIGCRLRALRRTLQLSAEQLARLLYISEDELQRLENGDETLSLLMLWDLCHIFDIAPEYFFSEIPGGLRDLYHQEVPEHVREQVLEDLKDLRELTESFCAIRYPAFRTLALDFVRRFSEYKEVADEDNDNNSGEA